MGCFLKIPFSFCLHVISFKYNLFSVTLFFHVLLSLFSSTILLHRSLHACIISHGLPSNPLFQFSSIKFTGITKSTSNEGTHSGTRSAFSSRLDEVSPNGQILPITPTLKIFSFAELKKATRNFRPDTIVGEGSFGRVFKGWIDEKTFAPTKAGRGMAIAVKKLNPESFKGRKEWKSEVNILGSLSHPNIVRLLGHCEEDKELLLVYEFMPRGSLENHLFRRGSVLQSLSWSIRLKIAIGAARGIAFLHCSERKIIYRSFKPSDILLDLNYNAKISDFGLARDGPQGEDSHVSTRVMGTYGYAAPEYMATGITKSTSNEGMHSGTATAFSSRLDEVSPNGQILPFTPTLKIFSFAELKKATSKFSPDTLFGEGVFGKVFKGWIDEKTFAPTKAGSGMAIAVKKLNSDDFQGHEEWQSEVNILGSLSHPNIVRLLGYCWEDKERLLVYEFMPRGSLSNHLFSRGSAFQSLSWSIRLKIAIGAARAIAFLHCSERKIISRDVKPSNILLDSNYDAKISNFGLAKNGPVGENSHVSTRVMGTYGYAAPEYVATGHLYVKSDVYGFGVVLLEMLSGMRAIDTNRPSGQRNLVRWAKPYLYERRKLLSHVMDQRLEGQYPSKGAVQAAQLILKCVQSEPRRRPSMSEVVKTLEQIQAIKHKPPEP